jgi:hypothetical protein
MAIDRSIDIDRPDHCNHCKYLQRWASDESSARSVVPTSKPFHFFIFLNVIYQSFYIKCTLVQKYRTITVSALPLKSSVSQMEVEVRDRIF